MLRHLIVLALALALAVEARPDHHHDEAEGNGHNHDHNHEDGPGHHHHHHHEHNHEKWEKYGQEWRDMRSEILEIRDGVSHIKEDLHKMEAGLDSAPSYEEAVQITGAEEKPGGKHMKIEYRSEVN
ncbi:unnamed protein product [Cyprideis torosa]|uniref:Uncharacterized protein n=1 Tax=Cyprideis torosa TaxID=163714 RepID=A0A7R8ZUI5_9CRUS|nr:unnamed protein product [Cyprideis torosa]CAG0909632.1 unnamed protein product [Cyprideis torosa]